MTTPPTEQQSFLRRNLPNALTCCNLVSGCIATAYAFGANPLWALIWIIIGATFDFFDGMSARLLGVSSPIGKELDSLADDVTFGVAPATILYTELSVIDYPSAMECLRGVLPFFAYVMAAFSALRLANFNIDTRQTSSFIGMPTPANALFWASLVVSMPDLLECSKWMVFVLMLAICVSSWLLVAEISMFALKFKHWGWRGNEVRYAFLGVSAIILLLTRFIYGFWIVVLIYVITSIAMNHRRG